MQLAHQAPQGVVQCVVCGIQQVHQVTEGKGELVERLRQVHRQDQVTKKLSSFTTGQADALPKTPADLGCTEPLADRCNVSNQQRTLWWDGFRVKHLSNPRQKSPGPLSSSQFEFPRKALWDSHVGVAGKPAAGELQQRSCMLQRKKAAHEVEDAAPHPLEVMQHGLRKVPVSSFDQVQAMQARKPKRAKV